MTHAAGGSAWAARPRVVAGCRDTGRLSTRTAVLTPPVADHPRSSGVAGARADVTGLCRTSLRTSWRTPALAELDLTAEQRRELLRLAARAALALGPETAELLTSWLERS
ncbi:hypothetical protein [Micromonospora sp. DT47]|uniref:hypothetical protein n=1 Tax=Micromonospora sp. DT47 TaxID=3393431 RepID=UPI003CF2C03F